MNLEARARATLGASSDAIHRALAGALDARGIRGGTFVDVGCGRGDLRRALGDRFDRYVGLDAVRYDGLPADVEFHAVDLDAAAWAVDEIHGDVVAAVETIEHLENPWAFVRALARLARAGGWIAVTTPNQLSALSLMTLAVKGRFSAFQDSMYPMHRTALLASDVERAMAAAGIGHVATAFTGHGRLPLSGRHYPGAVAGVFPRWCSDNVLIVGRKTA
ncbi:MAG TPA: class I SAM-dependent methyltransferase [Vicinamibacterales bacterium]|nr:class I SAM-dependent methyltransferase [Vicinamibacterales bacterium]